jgi:transposase InsO family protein
LREVVRLHQKYPTFGLDPLYRKVKEKLSCSRKRVWRLKKQAGIYSKHHKAYKCTTNSRHSNPISPNLLGRKYRAKMLNEAWVSDITYIPTGQGWSYLAIVKDLFTKKVVGWAFSSRIDTGLVLDALRMAARRARPGPGLIFHSDRGVQYASKAFRKALEGYGMRQSMSRKGDPYDNAVAENFFSCLKCECVHLNHFVSRPDAEREIFRYIEGFYNSHRPHSGIGWITPNDAESRFRSLDNPSLRDIA